MPRLAPFRRPKPLLSRQRAEFIYSHFKAFKKVADQASCTLHFDLSGDHPITVHLWEGGSITVKRKAKWNRDDIDGYIDLRQFALDYGLKIKE